MMKIIETKDGDDASAESGKNGEDNIAVKMLHDCAPFRDSADTEGEGELVALQEMFIARFHSRASPNIREGAMSDSSPTGVSDYF